MLPSVPTFSQLWLEVPNMSAVRHWKGWPLKGLSVSLSPVEYNGTLVSCGMGASSASHTSHNDSLLLGQPMRPGFLLFWSLIWGGCFMAVTTAALLLCRAALLRVQWGRMQTSFFLWVGSCGWCYSGRFWPFLAKPVWVGCKDITR